MFRREAKCVGLYGRRTKRARRVGQHGRMGLGERIGEHLWKGGENRSKGCMTKATTNAGIAPHCAGLLTN